MLKQKWHYLKSEIVPFFDRDYYPYLILFLSLFSIQLLLRFFDLGFHGVWRDEAASLYFAVNPSSVLLSDSHTPLYYVFLSPVVYFSDIDIVPPRLLHALVSFSLQVLLMWRTRKYFSQGQWFFFHSVYGLHPLVFGFARLARSYGLVLDLSVLLLFECRKFESKKFIFILSILLVSIYPMAFIPLVIEFLVSHRKKEFFPLIVAAIVPVSLYYVVKFLVGSNQLQFIGWINETPLSFFNHLSNLLMGSYYPFYESMPKDLGKYLLITLLLIIFIFLLFKKDPAARRHFVIFLSSFFGIYLTFNFISYLVDLRIARYYIFLLPYLLVALTFAIPTRKSGQLFFMVFFGGLLLSQVLVINPYFSKRESFGNFVSNLLTMKASTGAPTMGCGYSFHNWYMKQSGLLTCDDSKDLKVFEDYRGLLIYGYLGQQLSGLINANQDRIIRNIFPFSDGKIVWLSEKFSGVKNEK